MYMYRGGGTASISAAARPGCDFPPFVFWKKSVLIILPWPEKGVRVRNLIFSLQSKPLFFFVRVAISACCAGIEELMSR